MIRRRLRNTRLDPDVRDEIASHIEMRAQLNQERGMSREDAYRAARAGFGNATLIEEDVRAVHINTVLRPLAAIQVDGRPPFAGGTGGMVMWRYVSPEYFAALRIPIVRGRPFWTRTAPLQTRRSFSANPWPGAYTRTQMP